MLICCAISVRPRPNRGFHSETIQFMYIFHIRGHSSVTGVELSSFLKSVILARVIIVFIVSYEC